MKFDTDLSNSVILNKNILNKDNHLISEDIFNFLKHQRLSTLNTSSNSPRKSLFLVTLRVVKGKKNLLMFNYIKYPDIFYQSLKYFLLSKSDFSNSLVYKECGDFLTIFDDSIFKSSENKLSLNRANEYLYSHFNNTGMHVINEIGDTLELFYLINKLLYVADHNHMSDLIDLAFKKDIKKFADNIFNFNSSYSIHDRTFEFSEEMDATQFSYTKEFSFINECLFVVSDLNSFIKNIKDKGYIINEGPLKWRGQINSMDNFLCSIDIDYRNSLYEHNQYHIDKDISISKYYIERYNFSFKNIHQNKAILDDVLPRYFF
jgi:hypothetical protein